MENRDPRRGIGHEKVLTRIRLDGAAEELVREQGWELDSVPPAGVWIKLALTGNMSTGGTSIDRTMEAHPENVEIAETAARVVGLDIAGIDFIVPDIAMPVREQGGAIVEVNAAPGFRMHTHPTDGEPQYVAKPVIDLLFPPGTASRIPIIAVTGTNGKTTTVRMIAHILKLMGRRVGMTTTDGIVIDGRLIKRGDMSGPKSAQMVLQNPIVDTAVFEVARGGILREGLGYDRNDVAVVTNVTGDHLGLHGIDTLRQLADVKGVLVEAVPRSGTAVLNADDPLVARMARHCHGRIIYFSMATDREGGLAAGRHALRSRRRGHRAPGDRGRRAGRPAPWSARMPLIHTHLIPATFGGRARMNVANALAAAAAAWAAGAHMHDIRQGLRTFSTSFFQAPGRLNLIEMNGYRVIIDYCHNVDGMRRLTEFVDLLMAGDEPRRGRGRSRNGDGASPREVEPPKRTGRAFGVIGIPGDRPNGDQREYGALAAASFDASTSARTATCAAASPASRPSNVLAGVASAQEGRQGPDRGRRAGARRDGRRTPSAGRGARRRPDRRLCRRRRRRLPGGDGAQPRAATRDGDRGPGRDGGPRGLARAGPCRAPGRRWRAWLRPWACSPGRSARPTASRGPRSRRG